jgi:hypothetical protein
MDDDVLGAMPSHGENRGSSPLGSASKIRYLGAAPRRQKPPDRRRRAHHEMPSKPFSPPDEIGTKQTACSDTGVGSELTVKTFFFLSLALVLAASVAVIANTSSPSPAHTENSATYIY